MKSPDFQNIPGLLSLGTLLISVCSLLLGWATPEAFQGSIPELLRLEPLTALSFILLGLSMRLAHWERIDARTARKAKFSRMLAGMVVLSMLSSPETSFLLSAGLCVLAAVLILQAYRNSLQLRRVLLVASVISGTWLVLANLYAVHGRISGHLTADPASALLMFSLTIALCLMETRNGFIPDSMTAVLGERVSARLFVSALLAPLLLGFLRLQVESVFKLDTNLLLALHVLTTLMVMTVLLVSSMDQANERLEEQRRVQADLETTESALRALLAHGAEFYLTMNLAGRLLEANENARRYLALPDLRKTVICIEDLILRESYEKVKRLPETLLRGVSDHTVLMFRTSDGQALPLHVTAASRVRHGAPTEIVLVGRTLPVELRATA